MESLGKPFILINSNDSSSTSSAAGTDVTTISLSSSSTLNSRSSHQIKKSTSSIVKGFVCSNSGIITRLLVVLLAAVVALWANYEASKSFQITVINNYGESSPAGKRFSVFYVSDDKAIRMMLRNSVLIEKLLYPNSNLTKKHVDNVTLRLAAHNLNSSALTSASFNRNSDERRDYVIDLSPSLLEESDVDEAMELVIQRAMARIWIWDGDSKAPTSLIDGMVEYVADLTAGVRLPGELGLPATCKHLWWEDKNSSLVVNVLHKCEEHRKGFIQRLNQALKDTWRDNMIDDVLGLKSQQLCDSSYTSSLSSI